MAKKILKAFAARHSAHALVVSLEGNLGAGKTTFTQGFARGLGITQKITSPTFVVLKRYSIPARKAQGRERRLISLYHIDGYRLKNARELEQLGFASMLQDKGALVLIEWGDRMRKALPKNTLRIRFRHAGGNKRRIRVPAALGKNGNVAV